VAGDVPSPQWREGDSLAVARAFAAVGVSDVLVQLCTALRARPATITAHRLEHVAVEPPRAFEADGRRDECTQFAISNQGRCDRAGCGFHVPRHADGAQQLFGAIGATEEGDAFDLAVRLTSANDSAQEIFRGVGSRYFRCSHHCQVRLED